LPPSHGCQITALKRLEVAAAPALNGLNRYAFFVRIRFINTGPNFSTYANYPQVCIYRSNISLNESIMQYANHTRCPPKGGYKISKFQGFFRQWLSGFGSLGGGTAAVGRSLGRVHHPDCLSHTGALAAAQISPAHSSRRDPGHCHTQGRQFLSQAHDPMIISDAAVRARQVGMDRIPTRDDLPTRRHRQIERCSRERGSGSRLRLDLAFRDRRS